MSSIALQNTSKAGITMRFWNALNIKTTFAFITVRKLWASSLSLSKLRLPTDIRCNISIMFFSRGSVCNIPVFANSYYLIICNIYTYVYGSRIILIMSHMPNKSKMLSFTSKNTLIEALPSSPRQRSNRSEICSSALVNNIY